jgi:RHS repeat-associated protein
LTVYSEEEDYLEFYIDSVRQDRIDGEVYWEQKQYNISGSGSHTLKWRYIKDSEGEAGDDGGSVDWLQWSGSPPPDPTNWDTITYTYDPAGRRIKKNVVGSYIVKYVYDGGHVIAEYDNSNLLRKYIYGARVDEPVCMLDVADNNKAYYYHFDGLGSVVALSNSYGNSCQSYQYSVYGQVAASDPNFLANPYMFTGRRFDIETGLYYYRARYYNPHIGRFMQTDPVGDGMNWYAYCGNNPLAFVDPSGFYSMSVRIPTDCITNDPCATTATYDVSDWLDDVGFFDKDEYPNWYVESVSLNGAFFDTTLAGPGDMCDVDLKIPDFKFYKYDGFEGEIVHYATLDGIGLLDSKDRTLDNIIKSSFHEMNQQRRPLIPVILGSQLTIFKLADLANKLFGADQTPFLYLGPQQWRYKGKKYDRTEVNYILMGHGMKHQKVAHYLGVGLVRDWKLFRGNLTLPPSVLYWFNKGYGEYGERAEW